MEQKDLKGKTKKGIYWNFANQFSGYAIQFVIGTVMARLLSPQDYGVVAMPMVFIALAQCFVDSGFGTALIRKETVSERDLSTAFYFSIIVGVCSYSLLSLSTPYIASFYDTPVLEQLLKFTSLSLLFNPLISVQRVQLIRRINFKTPAIIDLSARLITGIIGIMMAYKGYGVWSLVIPSVCSNILCFLAFWSVTRWYPKERWSKESFQYLWGYGAKMLMSRLIDTAYINITPVIVGKFFSAQALGTYTRAQNYAQLPSQQLSVVIQNVTFPVLSKIQNDKERFVATFIKILKATVFIIFPLMMGLSALAHPLIVLLLSEKWLDCVILLKLLCFSNLFFPIHLYNVYVLIIIGRTDFYLKLEIFKKILGVSVLVISARYGLIYMIIGEICTSALSLYINTYYSGKVFNIGFLYQIKKILPSLILSLMMYGVIHIVTLCISNMITQMIVGILVGAGFYLSVAKISRFPELDDFVYMLKRNK